MKLLLTGASGFVGDYFIKNYAKDHKIQTFSFLNDDFEALDCNGIDVVIHLSALVHQMGGASANEYEKVNVTQTLELAKKAKASGVKQFIFMSTAKVYGEETTTTYTEQSPCNPQDNYSKSKFKAEQELLKLQDETFNLSIIRTPIVYGYGVKANIKNLVSLINKIQILPFRNIQNKRSIVYIGNLCHLLHEVIIQKKQGIFLAADDKSLSTSELILSIANALEKNIFLFKVPFFEVLLKLTKPSFHKRLYESLEVNNQETKNILSLDNLYSTDEGIKLMIKGEQF